jgi:hypothetical protein
MGNDQDLKALMSSEVFRNYLAIEMEREANAHIPTEAQIKEAKYKAEETKKAIAAFDQFEKSIKENFLLKKAFLDLKKQLSENPELSKKLGAKFINALAMLDLEEDSTF